MPIPAYIEGDLRIQFLSSSLVRIEQKGPKGFEDRLTFTAVDRNWKGVPYHKEGSKLITDGYAVVLNGSQMKGVQVVVGGKTVYTVGALPGKNWLPDPGKTGPVWDLADSPRLITPKGGAIPENLKGALGSTTGYDTGNDAPDLYLFITRDPNTLRKDFLKLTGPIPLVPRYTMGYWDSRWFPYSEQTALASIDEYHKRNIPLDLFVCDTDWRVGASKGYGVDTTLFPDMTRFLKEAHEKGVRVMFNDHPEPQAPTALDPVETNYRYNGLTDLLGKGLDVWWYDRNWSTHLHEPMPGLSKETWGSAVFQDVTLSYRPNLRPLIMSNVDGIDNGIRHRAPDPAFHRYPINWTGDTGADWPFLVRAVQNGVDEGTIGMLPYVLEDGGGHNMGQPSPELYSRFLQYCALSPVLRVHCTAGLTRYPWAFGPEAEVASEEAIKFRYRLIPTLYSATFRTHEDGTPLVRRLDLEWPNLPEAASNRQYLLADDLLVSPVTESDTPPLTPYPGTFKGEYFANVNLEGQPALVRNFDKIDFDWGYGSPAQGLPAQNFSVRWTGQIGPMSKTMDYQFATSTDDGVRLWIDGKPVIDQWKPLDSVTNLISIHLEAGKTYDFKMEYYQAGGGSNAHFLWGGDNPRVGPHTWTFWCPPGKWQNPWDGKTVTGPTNVTMDVPLRQVPSLIRDGAVFFLGDDKVVNSDEQFKKPITIEAYPGPSTTRSLIEDDGVSLNAPRRTWKATAEKTSTGVSLRLSGPKSPRDFVVRLHLAPGEKPNKVTIDGKRSSYSLETPAAPAVGLETLFAARGGNVVEIKLSHFTKAHSTILVRTK